MISFLLKKKYKIKKAIQFQEIQLFVLSHLQRDAGSAHGKPNVFQLFVLFSCTVTSGDFCIKVWDSASKLPLKFHFLGTSLSPASVRLHPAHVFYSFCLLLISRKVLCCLAFVSFSPHTSPILIING